MTHLNTGGFLHDEAGALSMARLLLAVVIPFDLWVVWYDITTAAEGSAVAYGLLGSLTVALIAWAGGPRGLKYLGGQVAGVARGISSRLSGGYSGSVSLRVGTDATRPPAQHEHDEP